MSYRSLKFKPKPKIGNIKRQVIVEAKDEKQDNLEIQPKSDHSELEKNTNFQCAPTVEIDNQVQDSNLQVQQNENFEDKPANQSIESPPKIKTLGKFRPKPNLTGAAKRVCKNEDSIPEAQILVDPKPNVDEAQVEIQEVASKEALNEGLKLQEIEDKEASKGVEVNVKKLKFKPKPNIGGIRNIKDRQETKEVQEKENKDDEKVAEISIDSPKLEEAMSKPDVKKLKFKPKPNIRGIRNIKDRQENKICQNTENNDVEKGSQSNLDNQKPKTDDQDLIQETDISSLDKTPVKNLENRPEVKTPKGVRSLTFKPKIPSAERHERSSKFTASTYGKMSHEARQQMMKKFGTLTPDRCNLTMLDLIYLNPKDNPMKNKESKSLKKEKSPMTDITNPEEEERLEEERIEEDGLENNPVPQLKITPEGNVVIAPESLVLKKDPILETRTIVGEDEFTKRKVTKTNPDRQKWSFEETVNFYKALNTIGSDFETMKSIFPDRSRKSLKCKFKREERINGRLVDKMLGTQYAKFDLEKLKKELAVGIEYHRNLNNIKQIKGSAERDSVLKKAVESQDGELKPKKRKKRSNKIIGNIEIENEDVLDSPRPKRSRIEKSMTDLSPSSSDSELDISLKKRNRKSNLKFVEELLRLEELNRFNSGGDNIVINTNINLKGVKYTKSITFNPNDLDQPIDVNETITHCDQDYEDIEDQAELNEDLSLIVHDSPNDIRTTNSFEDG